MNLLKYAALVFTRISCEKIDSVEMEALSRIFSILPTFSHVLTDFHRNNNLFYLEGVKNLLHLEDERNIIEIRFLENDRQNYQIRDS